MHDPDEQMREADELSRMLVLITEAAKSDFAGIAAALDLPVPVARAIVMLSTPAPMRDLADHLACDRSYVTSLADQLEDRGLVSRVPGADRRVRLLQLTEAGLQTRRDISRAVADKALVLRRLDATQRTALRPLLEALLTDSAPETAT